MAFVLGERSKAELIGVEPGLVALVELAIQITPQDFSVHDGLRTIEQQREYVARGASRTMDSRHLKQDDGYGHAVDLEHISTIRGHLMARIAALGRRVAQRDAVPSGKRRNASSASRRATEGRVLFAVGRVARRLTKYALAPYINGRLRWEWPLIYPICRTVRAVALQHNLAIRWGGVWDRKLNDLVDDPVQEVAAYIERRRALGQSAFLDGPHYELVT